jgi:hypothetical protein
MSSHRSRSGGISIGNTLKRGEHGLRMLKELSRTYLTVSPVSSRGFHNLDREGTTTEKAQF